MKKHSIILIVVISVIVIGIVAMLFLLGGDKEQEVGQLPINPGETVTDTDDSNATVEDEKSQNEVQEAEIWEVYNNGEIKNVDGVEGIYINTYNGTEEVVTIPSEIEGVRVIGLTGNSFYMNKNIKEVIIPETVITISGHAFYECKNLEKVLIPDTVSYIGEEAFAYCTSLKEITLPRDLETIGTNAFSCSGLEKINFNCIKLKEIPNHSFDYIKLEVLRVPECVTKLDCSFFGVTTLKEVYIPETTTELDCAFNDSPDVVIYGKPGSAAEYLAKDYEYKFIAQ